MKTILIFLLISSNLFSQSKDTVKSSWYGRVMPVSFYTGAGSITNKISQNIEIGKSYSVIDVGLAYGRYNLQLDSTKFLEGRITVDAFQLNNISSEFTIGGGYVFRSINPIMLEISYTILVQVHKNIGLGVITGYYDFSGPNKDVNKTFFGVFLRCGLLRTMSGGLFSGKTKRHNHF